MSRPHRLTDVLTFSSVTTSETARQRLTKDSANITSARLKRLHIQRTAGTGALVFIVRVYDAAASGYRVAKFTYTLNASGTDDATTSDEGSDAGLDLLVDAGAWVTVEAASGTGHEVDIFCQYGNVRDF